VFARGDPALPLSRPGGGVILNNSSVHEIIPKPKYLSYSISKGGIENLTKSGLTLYPEFRLSFTWAICPCLAD
jgi:NAD(P)-dependent dehydrogenase (short-subunit alcohol dehydrogenase family)